MAQDFSIRKKSEYSTTTRTGPNFHSVVAFIQEIMLVHGWKRISLVHEKRGVPYVSDLFCHHFAGALVDMLKAVTYQKKRKGGGKGGGERNGEKENGGGVKGEGEKKSGNDRGEEDRKSRGEKSGEERNVGKSNVEKNEMDHETTNNNNTNNDGINNDSINNTINNDNINKNNSTTNNNNNNNNNKNNDTTNNQNNNNNNTCNNNAKLHRQNQLQELAGFFKPMAVQEYSYHEVFLADPLLQEKLQEVGTKFAGMFVWLCVVMCCYGWLDVWIDV